jgi:hypothetical protein
MFFRNNPLAYLAVAFGSVAAPPLVDLFSQPIGFYRWNGALLSILVAVVLLWLLVPFRKLYGSMEGHAVAIPTRGRES